VSPSLVVLDTNILVSALLRSFGPSARVLDLVLAGVLRAAYDDRILAEWREVLHRERFGFPAPKVDAVLRYLEREGLRVSATVVAQLPDPDDAAFLEVAATCGATLVTGNGRHYPPDRQLGVTVLEPRAFLEGWNARP
jgi:putative PIN family toxin of toxin-antitoxin system